MWAPEAREVTPFQTSPGESSATSPPSSCQGLASHDLNVHRVSTAELGVHAPTTHLSKDHSASSMAQHPHVQVVPKARGLWGSCTSCIHHELILISSISISPNLSHIFRQLEKKNLFLGK